MIKKALFTPPGLPLSIGVRTAVLTATLLAPISLTTRAQGFLPQLMPAPPGATAYRTYQTGLSDRGTEVCGAAEWYSGEPGAMTYFTTAWLWSPSLGFITTPGGVLSGDGKVLVGGGWVGLGAFPVPVLDRWTVSGGLEHLGTPPFYEKYRYNYDGYLGGGSPLKVSPDGSAVVVYASATSECCGDLQLTYVWTINDGFIEVPFRYPYSISRNCDILIGDGGFWTKEGGLQPLPLPADVSSSGVVSGNGKVFAGVGARGSSSVLWRWTAAGAFEDLGLPLPYSDPAQYYVVAQNVSDSGNEIDGILYSAADGSWQSWWWSAVDGLVLGSTPGTGVPAFSFADFSPAADGWSDPAVSQWTPDRSVVYGSGVFGSGQDRLPWLAAYKPVIEKLSPAQAAAGTGDISMSIYGIGFDPATARVLFGEAGYQTELVPNPLTSTATRLDVVISAELVTGIGDFRTYSVAVRGGSGALSKAEALTVYGASVGAVVDQVESKVAVSGEIVVVKTVPATADSAGVAASLENTGGTEPATVTVATYTANPTSGAGFDAGAAYVDIKISGADPDDRLSSSFYYPQSVRDAAEAALTLKFYNGTTWVDVLGSSGTPPEKNTTDNLDGTISGGRFRVVLDNTSTPKITELTGTVFAVAPPSAPDTTPPAVSCPNISIPANLAQLVPVIYPAPTVSDDKDPAPSVTYSIPIGSGFPVGITTVACTATDRAGNKRVTTFTVTRAALDFVGFLSPVGGADSTGGSFSAPVRTFKSGSTIPVKFTANCGSSPVTTGTHRLQAIKYTNATTTGAPIDATPQEAATTGDQFRFTSGQWQFNLDTKAAGLTTGVWVLQATLSDGSQHSVWIQIK